MPRVNHSWRLWTKDTSLGTNSSIAGAMREKKRATRSTGRSIRSSLKRFFVHGDASLRSAGGPQALKAGERSGEGIDYWPSDAEGSWPIIPSSTHRSKNWNLVNDCLRLLTNGSFLSGEEETLMKRHENRPTGVLRRFHSLSSVSSQAAVG